MHSDGQRAYELAFILVLLTSIRFVLRVSSKNTVVYLFTISSIGISDITTLCVSYALLSISGMVKFLGVERLILHYNIFDQFIIILIN